MIEVKNLCNFTRAYFVNGREWIFKANETRKVNKDFLTSDGNIKFMGLQLVQYRVPLDMITKRTKIGERDRFIYILRREDWQEPVVVFDLKKFCDEHDVNYNSILVYSATKDKYKNWFIEKISIRKWRKKPLEYRKQFKYLTYDKDDEDFVYWIMYEDDIEDSEPTEETPDNTQEKDKTEQTPIEDDSSGNEKVS